MEEELRQHLLNHSIKLLTLRSHSEKELRRKLTVYVMRKKQLELLKQLDWVINKLKDMHYLSDEDFAEQFSSSRLSGKPRSKRVLEFELKQRGLSADIIEKTLSDYDELEACRKAAAKKSRYSKEQLKEYLRRQGFPWECIKEAVGYQS